MLRQILSITGRPGLYRIISQGNRMIIVEDLTTGQRIPAHQRDKIVSLGDISMYTEAEDLPLDVILDRLYAHEEGKTIDIKALTSKSGALREEFAAVVPDFDRDRVHDSDIRKLFQWYNLLVNAGYTRFTEEEKEATASEDASPEEEKK